MCNCCDGSKLSVGDGGTVVGGGSVCGDCEVIRPSQKGGLCMSAVQKNLMSVCQSVCLSDCLSTEFEICDVCRNQPCSRDKPSIK